MDNFESLELSPALNKSLKNMDYKKPTPIQAEAIPLALAGRDILGSAQTGTGKTAAFAIPLVEKLLNSEHGSAIVLTPTRELGKQVMGVIQQLLGYKSKIKTAFIIGGESMGKQFGQLRQNPRIIVGTPGRINDHLERGTIKLNQTDFVVMDETDRMLDMGFSVQIDRILKHVPKKRQTLLFSATLPKNIVKLAEAYLTNPARVAIGSTTTPLANIKQEVIRVKGEEKYKELVGQLHERTGSVIIFMKTKYATERLAKKLNNDNFTAEAIHGDLKQNRRERTIREMRNDKFRILVATDVVARGIDIPHIEHVINYDLPQVAEDYIHRIGRTARAGASGSALSFLSPQDGRKWHAIEMLIDPDKKHKKPEGDYKSKKKKSHGKKRWGNRPANDRLGSNDRTRASKRRARPDDGSSSDNYRSNKKWTKSDSSSSSEKSGKWTRSDNNASSEKSRDNDKPRAKKRWANSNEKPSSSNFGKKNAGTRTAPNGKKRWSGKKKKAAA